MYEFFMVSDYEQYDSYVHSEVVLYIKGVEGSKC